MITENARKFPGHLLWQANLIAKGNGYWLNVFEWFVPPKQSHIKTLIWLCFKITVIYSIQIDINAKNVQIISSLKWQKPDFTSSLQSLSYLCLTSKQQMNSDKLSFEIKLSNNIILIYLFVTKPVQIQIQTGYEFMVLMKRLSE